jgi:hypothetical protein
MEPSPFSRRMGQAIQRHPHADDLVEIAADFLETPDAVLQ